MKIEIKGNKELERLLIKAGKDLKKETQKALVEEAEIVKKRFEQVSPVSNKPGVHLKDSWEIKEYDGVVYVGNTKLVKNKNANPPLINILENKPGIHYKFLSRNWNAWRNEIENDLIKKIEKIISQGGNKNG